MMTEEEGDLAQAAWEAERRRESREFDEALATLRDEIFKALRIPQIVEWLSKRLGAKS